MTQSTRESPEQSVRYELDRLIAYDDHLRDGVADDEVRLALIEAYLVHYRNLLDFLSSRGKPDTVKANEYVPGFSTTLVPEQYRDDINRALSHLSRDRGNFPVRTWYTTQMLNEIGSAWNVFLEEFQSLT